MLWLLGVLALTGLVVGFCSVTASSLEREALTHQQVRTNETASRLEEKFLVIDQIARTMAVLVAPMRAREDVEQLLQRVLASTPCQYVYGVGVWFEPYAFSRQEEYFGPYARRAGAGRTGPIVTYEWATPSYDYHHQHWYSEGIRARGTVVFIEPYFDTDHVYMSSLTAILDDRGEAVGVASVDVLLPQIQRFIEDESSSANETIYVTTRRGALLAHPAAAEILEWARSRGRAPLSLLDLSPDDLRAFEAERRPERDAITTTATVSRLGWTAATATDRRRLFADARRFRWGTAPAVALLWSGALSLHLGSRRARRLKELAQDLERRELVEAERARLLERIRQRSAELQAILDSMADGVIACDSSLGITLMNHAARRLLGIEPGESCSLDTLMERLQLRFPDGRRTERQDLPIVQALSGGALTQGTLVIEVPGGPRETHVHAVAAPIRDSEGRIVAAVAVFRDVTGAIELDHVKDQFLKVTAHELKTPITIMKSYAQLALRQGEGLPPALRRTLEGINRGADRIDRIMRDLLDVSQVYLGRLQLVLTALDLRELLERTAGQLGADPSKHRVRVHAERSAMVRGDRHRLEKVILTLLDNAVRYSPEGGDIDVSLTVEGAEAVVAVEDHGIGIPADGQSRIFERFYRAHSGTDQDYGGLGVGLYISKQLVQQLGGRMWFLSTEEGSRFMLSLPLAPEEGRGS